MTAEAVKTCTQCGDTKPHLEFYTNRTRKDGLSDQCRACVRLYREATREMQRRTYLEHAEERRRYAREHRKAHRDAYLERKRQTNALPEERERQRQWKVANREAIRAYNKRYRDNKPYVAIAGTAVLTAVRAGKLPPVSQCECFMCGKQAQDYHHVDYSKPLDVFPVCTSCHKRWHAANEVRA